MYDLCTSICYLIFLSFYFHSLFYAMLLVCSPFIYSNVFEQFRFPFILIQIREKRQGKKNFINIYNVIFLSSLVSVNSNPRQCQVDFKKKKQRSKIPQRQPHFTLFISFCSNKPKNCRNIIRYTYTIINLDITMAVDEYLLFIRFCLDECTSRNKIGIYELRHNL